MLRKYPSQFWLMLVGLIISSTGTTMVWPFLTIYASEKLSMPMAAVTSLMSFNSLRGLQLRFWLARWWTVSGERA